jgi:anaerobic selenocysteine-containing dehydrogenase
MKGRIAEALGIRDGDVVEFELIDVGDTIRLTVRIRDDISSDVLIHDWLSLGICQRCRVHSWGRFFGRTKSVGKDADYSIARNVDWNAGNSNQGDCYFAL